MYDVFFLSYDEPHAHLHWRDLKEKYPLAQQVNGISGIQAAHRECARRCRTSHFFVVDSDNEVLDPSIFRMKLEAWDAPYVHLWHARNLVNGLEYGWGAIKLFPKAVFDDMAPRLDMTTSYPLKLIPEVKSITHFNVSAEETWRSAFRECVKLSQQDTEEAQERLRTWTTTARGGYAEMCLRGAQEGHEYGLAHRADPDALMLINDYAWLAERF